MDPNFHVSSATFSYTFKNFSKINKLTQSPACWIQNLPWKIFVESVMRDRRKYLSIFVGCTETITPWSCRASIRMYKLHGTHPKIVRTVKSLVFDSAASTSWGHTYFIQWDTVLDPSNGYITNDSITVEVTIDAEVPNGLRLTADHFTDERANSALKECENSLQNLQNKVRDLTIENEDNEKAKNLLIQEQETLETKLEAQRTTYVQQLDDCLKALENQKGKVESDKINQDLLSNEKADNDKLRKTIEEQNAQILSVTEKLNQANENLKKKETEFSKNYEMMKQKLAEQNLQITKKLNEVNEVDEALKKTVNEYKENDDKLRREIEEKKTQVVSLSQKLNELNETLKQSENERENMSVKLLAASNELENLKKPKDTLKTNIQNNVDAKCQVLQSENTNLKSTSNATNLKLQQLEAQSNELQSLLAEKESLRKKLGSVSEELATEKNKLQSLKLEKEKLDAQIVSTKSDSDNANLKIKLLEDQIKEIQSKRSEENDLQNKIEELSSKNKELTEIKDNKSRESENLRLKSEHLETQVASMSSELKAKAEEVKELEAKRADLQMKFNSISDELTSLKNELNLLKLNNSKEIGNLKSVKEELENQVSSLKSKFLEDKEKFESLQSEKNTEVNELNEEKAKLMARIDNELREYNKLKVEKVICDTKVRSLNEDLNKAREEIAQLKTNLSKKQQGTSTYQKNIEKIQTEKKNLQATLEKLTNELNTKKLGLAEKINSTEITRLTNQNKKLENEFNSLHSQFDKANIRLKELEAKNCDHENLRLTTEKINLQARLRNTTKELEEVKGKLDSSKNVSEKLKAIKEENEKLKNKMLTLDKIFIECKEELQRSKAHRKKYEEENETLKNQITILNSQLVQCKSEINRASTATTNNMQKRTLQNEDPEFGIDLISGKYTDPIDVKKVSKSNDSNVSAKEKCLLNDTHKCILSELKLDRDIDRMRKQFEKNIRDADDKFEEKRRFFMKKIKDLQLQLDDEKSERQLMDNAKKNIEDELDRIRRESELHCKEKNNLLTQLNHSHRLCREMFQIISKLVKSINTSGKLPCSFDSCLRSIMKMTAKSEKMTCHISDSASTSEDDGDSDPVVSKNYQTTRVQISTEYLQGKLDELEGQLEKKLDILSKQYSKEKNRTKQLKLVVKNLSTLMESEILMSKQCKELVKNANLRVDILRNQLDDLDNQLYIERKKKCQFEKECENSRKCIETMESQISQLKKNMCRKARDVTEDLACSSSEKALSVQDEKKSLGIALTSEGTEADIEAKNTTNPVEIPHSLKHDNQLQSGVINEQNGEETDDAMEKPSGRKITESSSASS